MRVRNNHVTLVVHDKRRDKEWFYVFAYLDATTEWNIKHIKSIIYRGNNKRTQRRDTALLIAHRSIECEFGVHILTLWPRKY